MTETAGPDGPDGEMHVDGFARWTLRAIAPSPERVVYVRQQVARVLRLWRLDATISTVELVMSELVTNAVRHACTPFTVILAWDGRNLHGEVIDVNPGRPVLNLEPGVDELGGRGLFLVQQVVTRWGCDLHGQGKTVYFDLTP